MSFRTALIAVAAVVSSACAAPQGKTLLQERYEKIEADVPMRDGVSLHVVLYAPKDRSTTYPFLMRRTPYSCGPYGAEYARSAGPGGSDRFMEAGYIFVCQDVRGRFMSGGTFDNMTPHRPVKSGPTDTDESTDTYDTVEWLLANVDNHNGRVGLHGISYPGFYAAASIIDTHPAIKASSPQAPIADWFRGDDFHHNGAFYLQDAYSFFGGFEGMPPNPTSERGERLNPDDAEDAYRFFLDLGAVSNIPGRTFRRPIAFWDSMFAHPDYDEFWQRRNLVPHLKNVTASTLTVAGFFDAEDPYGPIEIYRSIEAQNPGIENRLVLGPWFHGGWERSTGDRLGNVSFGQETATWYRENVDLPFFEYTLKGAGDFDPPEVLAYASGSNAWHRLSEWPPASLEEVSLYPAEGGTLRFEAPTGEGADSYRSDPANPVPYTREKTMDRTREYMVEDQRFLEGRPDVLTYTSAVLTEDMTFAGPMSPELFVSSTGTDADFIVKLIDVYPDDAPEHQGADEKYMDVPMAGYRMLVRGEVFRARYRNSYEFPEPLIPGEATRISFDAPHLFHTFKAGHRVMVQVQSTWFPLVDRNPQRFVENIYHAGDSDFVSATQTVHRSEAYPSRIRLGRYR